MLKEAALRSLKGLLPKGQVFTDRASLVAYEVDAGIDKGLPEGVVFPRTPEEVMRVARWAAEYRVPLIARGAGTGLSGGAVADRGGVIVEFAHMNRILDLDERERSAVVEPALINLRLDERARTVGLYFPPDPSSQRASTIGGNVAENSGGPHCFKYGVTTNYVTGLDVVLADGSFIRAGGRAMDYPGYDLCGLITGSEGMLGLMTSISVRLIRNPPAVKTMLAIFDSVEQAGVAVSAIIAAGLMPATMEMMDQKITHMIEPFAQAGLPLDAGAVLIIEIDGYAESLDAQAEEIARILQVHGVRETRISSNEEERARIWLARKSAAGAITRLAPAYYTVDVTVPRSRLAEVLHDVNLICERYGLQTGHLLHAGDGNLHPMLLIPEPENPDLIRRIHQAGWEIVNVCVGIGGSLTGEHGVGIEKREYMSAMHTPAELLAMWDVKQAFDPANILNPGKVFPTPSREESGPFAGYTHPSSTAASSELPLALTDDVFTPRSAEEAAHGLASCTNERRAIYIGKANDHAQSAIGALRLNTGSLRGIKTYAPDDLYITVGSGTPLAEVQNFLAQDRKQLALASPWSDTTIGGLIATNLNAPLRMRYGAIRDLVLCATIALPDGRVIRSGRPLVKNVAGYDLTKAFVGSHGTLGLLTDATLKVMVQPRARRTLLLPVEDMRYGLIWGGQLLPLALNASALLFCKGYQSDTLPQSPYFLIYTAEGIAEDVEAELTQVRQLLQMTGAPTPIEDKTLSGTDIWVSMLSHQEALQVRVGLPPRSLPAYLQDMRGHDDPFIADLAGGMLYISRQGAATNDWLASLRKRALASEGYAVVMSQPEALPETLDRWGYRPDGLKVMKALKQRWDVNGILNPGVFIV